MKPNLSYFFEPTLLKAERLQVDSSEMSSSRQALAHRQLDSARIPLSSANNKTFAELRFLAAEAIPFAAAYLSKWTTPYPSPTPGLPDAGASVQALELEVEQDERQKERQKLVYLHDPLAPRTVPPLKLDSRSAWSFPATSKWDLNFECTAWKGAKTGSTMLTFGYADLVDAVKDPFSSANSASRKYAARLLNSISEVADAVLHSQTFKDRATPSSAIKLTLRSEWLFDLEKARDLIWGRSEATERAAINISVVCWTLHRLFVVSRGTHEVALLTDNDFRLLHLDLMDSEESKVPLDARYVRDSGFMTADLHRDEVANKTLLLASFDISAMLRTVRRKRPGLVFRDVGELSKEISNRLFEDQASHEVFSLIRLDRLGDLSC